MTQLTLRPILLRLQAHEAQTLLVTSLSALHRQLICSFRPKPTSGHLRSTSSECAADSSLGFEIPQIPQSNRARKSLASAPLRRRRRRGPRRSPVSGCCRREAGMEGCSKMSAGAASGIPEGPLVEILSRVPARSVCRFKCVSKGWCDLIADPAIRKKLLSRAMQGLFVMTGEYSEDDGNEVVRTSFSFIDLTVRSVPLDIDPSFSFLTEQTGIQTSMFFDSCNGLILFRYPPPGGYIVCNPITKRWSAVPACGSLEAVTRTYLAFDPEVSSHFHLVQFQMPDVDTEIESLHVYSSETGTWSQNQIDEQNEQGQLEGWHHQVKLEVLDDHCAFVNGFLHLLVWGQDRKHILVVDIQGKARKIINVPGMADGSQMNNITDYLGQSQGHLHCVTIESAGENNDNISTWVLQDYDTQEWVLKRTFNSLVVFGETEVRPEYQVVDIHQDSNVLFFSNLLTHELIAYDMDREEVSVLDTFQELKLRCDFARYVPYYFESPALTNNVL